MDGIKFFILRQDRTEYANKCIMPIIDSQICIRHRKQKLFSICVRYCNLFPQQQNNIIAKTNNSCKTKLIANKLTLLDKSWECQDLSINNRYVLSPSFNRSVLVSGGFHFFDNFVIIGRVHNDCHSLVVLGSSSQQCYSSCKKPKIN